MAPSEEDIKRAGQCSYMMISLCSTAAFFCGIYSTSDCDFVDRDITLSGGDVSAACGTLGFASDAFCNTFLNNHAVGLYGWQGTIPVNQKVCLSYTQPIAGVGYVEPEFDTKFNSVRAFSIVANVFGGIAFFTLLMAACCPLTQSRLKGLSCHFFIATLFQGLTLLIFKSDICEL